MAIDGVSVLAVVPARGGSKGIPHKNLREICGLSLVGHAARTAAALPWIDLAVISTDDEEIAAEAVRNGLPAPFRRPPELAHDTATSVDMWRHAWLASEAFAGRRFDVSVLLEPTSPLRRPEDLEETVRTLLAGGHAAAATVSRNPAHYTPEKTLVLSDEKIIGFYLKDRAQSIRQFIPPYYHRNGICYATRRDTLVERGQIVEHDCAAVVIEREVVNIDTPFELELAEWIMKREAAV
jgi:CMP-N,N'-diacetyllegionaminic acid synthase